MPKKAKVKFPRAVFKVKMGTRVITPAKGKGAKDLNPYSRKAKHKKPPDTPYMFGGFIFQDSISCRIKSAIISLPAIRDTPLLSLSRIIFPPASSTSSIPAATSHGCKFSSQ